MKALVCVEQQVTMQEIPSPTLGPEMVRIHVKAIGVNRADLLQRRGLYPAPEGVRNDILGLECAGVVIECHDSLSKSEQQRWLQQRVMVIVAGEAYAEEVVVHKDILLPVPDQWSIVQAAAFPEAFMTAFDALWLQSCVQSEHRVLIHAVTSGVGDAARQLCAFFGIDVWGSTRTRGKVPYIDQTTCQSVLITEGQFPPDLPHFDVILDLVGAAYLPQNIHHLAYRGTIHTIGLMGGVLSPIGLHHLLKKNGRIQGTTLRDRCVMEKGEICRLLLEAVQDGIRDGSLKPTVDSVFAWTDVDAAHQKMGLNQHIGKIVLEVQ